jgi:segregation and condensation protein A
VARFLAVLELYRETSVDLQQPEPFGELTVRWTPSAHDQPEQAPATDD